MTRYPLLILLVLLLVLVIPAVCGESKEQNMYDTPDISIPSLQLFGEVDSGPTSDDYARAEKLLPQNVIPSLYNTDVEPHWIPGTSSFWYLSNWRSGEVFFLVNMTEGTKKEAFDHARLGAALEETSEKTADPAHLPITSIKFLNGFADLEFTAFNQSWRYDQNTGVLHQISAISGASDGMLISPDGEKAVFLSGDNLFVRYLHTGTDYPLTTDGITDYFYARISDTTSGVVSEKRSGDQVAPYAVWSTDSMHLRTFHVDQRNVSPLYLLQEVPEDGTIRPIQYTYHYSMPGEQVAAYEPVVIHLKDRSVTGVMYPPWPTTSMMDTDQFVLSWWKNDSTMIYSVYVERGETVLRFLEENPVSGEVREIITETGPSYRETNLDYAGRPNVYVYETNGDIIWFSERDGWGHLYLYDSQGELKNQVTSGEWVVRSLVFVDEESEWIYFLAGGREPGRDPYYRHLYRVRPDGSDLSLLTPEDADHEISFSPDGKYFVDSYSRIDIPPVTVARDSEGTIILELEKADISYLATLGWNAPEQIKVKARDGTTDLYGLIIYPTNFDPRTRYPVIDSVYPGPQIIVTAKAFPSDYGYNSKVFWKCQALSELGFIVVNLDGLGTPYRSKSFHDVAYGHMSDAGGLPDHVGALLNLCHERTYMDPDRVGIYGHSGGGFMTAQALLTYPDFYRVGVASAGNHDNRLYGSYWGEKYEGLPNGTKYLEQVTAEKASNLTGHLLLVTGDLDDNVHPSMTMQLVDALIDANKTVDMLVLPNRNHEFNYDPYFIKRLFDYFVLHFKGVEPPDYVFDVPWLPD